MNKLDFTNILVPFNRSEGGKKGFHAALEWAKKCNGKITVITCIENQPLSFFFRKSHKKSQDEQVQLIKKEILKLKKQADTQNIPFNFVIKKSSFHPDTIVEYSNQKSIGLIILGLSKLIGTEGKYHTSTRDYLEDRVTCPLLTIP